MRKMLSCKSQVCVCECVLYLEAAVCSPMVEQSQAVTCLHTVPKSSCLLESGLVKRSDSYYISISELPSVLSHNTENTILSIMEPLVGQDCQRHYIVITQWKLCL